MGDTPVAYIDETGIHVPDFATVENYFLDSYRGIYGQDVYLGNDSQDRELLDLFATAINDANAMAVQCYNSFSPSTAVGTGLSSVVKINGIERKVPSRSSADVLIVGQAGTVVTDGVVSDANSVEWNLPTTVIIPYEGQILVAALCTILGTITAPAGTITTIVNSQPGWQTVTNPSDATPGLPVEKDPQLKARQTLSTEIPSRGLVEGTVGAIWELSGIRAISAYENDTNVPDANGIPGHCLSFVIDGGDLDAIAGVIQAKKGGGVGTYGNVVRIVTDEFGVPHQVAFFRPLEVSIAWVVTLRSLGGFTMNTQAAIAKALSDWTNGLGIGKSILVKRAYVPANLSGAPAGNSFELLDLEVSVRGRPASEDDVTIAFNERAFCDPTYIQFLFPDSG